MSTKRKLPAKLAQPVVKQAPRVVNKSKLDESRVVVSRSASAPTADVETVEISSDSSSDVSDSEHEPDTKEVTANGDVEMHDAGDNDDDDDDGDAAPAEPSFGDLVRANASEPIDVAAYDEPSADVGHPRHQPPTGASLGTVLTQALKTNDTELLESCLLTHELDMIRATIQRLPSPLAGHLLQKLAERLHRRPGRAGSLMVWVQWTLVTHGGYLATQPDLIQRLVELNKVIDERARSLQHLLSLKGKLDMLSAQMQLRRSLQHQPRMDDDDDDDEDEVIYVEGEEDSDDANHTSIRRVQEASDDERVELNGHLDEDESDDGLIDDEAEETDDASDDEDEVDHDEADSDDDDSEDAGEMAPPSKKRR